MDAASAHTTWWGLDLKKGEQADGCQFGGAYVIVTWVLSQPCWAGFSVLQPSVCERLFGPAREVR
jgi:hypothetical protein